MPDNYSICYFYNDFNVFGGGITVPARTECHIVSGNYDLLSGTNAKVRVSVYDCRLYFNNIPISALGQITGVYR